MSLTKFQFALASLLLGGAAAIVIFQHRAHMALGSQNALLHQKVAQLAAENANLSNRLFRTRTAPALSLPAPSMHNVAAAQPAEALSASNLIAHVAHGGEVPPLTAAQVQRYLEANHRSAASLLAAYRTSHDPALLQEAMGKYPADSKVAFEAVLSKELSPAARQEWLEAFKKAAPENPLPAYLSARDYFKSSQTDQAVQELIAAAGRPGFADYTVERIQLDEEAYRAAGYSEADAKMAATWGVALPQLADLRALGQNMVDLAASYRQAGDDNSAQATLQVAISLGQQLDASNPGCVPLVTRLVGVAVERMALEALDPSSAYGEGTVRDRLDQLAQHRDATRNLVKQSAPLMEQMTSEEWLLYNQRTLTLGEENAIAWLLNKNGQK